MTTDEAAEMRNRTPDKGREAKTEQGARVEGGGQEDSKGLKRTGKEQKTKCVGGPKERACRCSQLRPVERG